MNARSSCPVLGYAVRLRGIRIDCHVGVSDTERAKLQEVVVSVDAELAGERYPTTDELERAVDYAAISCAVAQSAEGRRDDCIFLPLSQQPPA